MHAFETALYSAPAQNFSVSFDHISVLALRHIEHSDVSSRRIKQELCS
jgi:hypothetical protein